MTLISGMFRLVIVWLLFSFGVQAQEKVITWATNPKYPPYDWSHEDSHYDGAASALLRLIIPQGYTLRPVMVPWPRAQLMAKEGRIDLLVNIRITPDRSEWLEFSKNPTFPNPIAVFMRKDKAIPFRSWDELKPLRGGVTVGDYYGNGFDEYLNAHLNIEPSPKVRSNFLKLEKGTYRLLCVRLLHGNNLAGQYQYAGHYRCADTICLRQSNSPRIQQVFAAPWATAGNRSAACTACFRWNLEPYTQRTNRRRVKDSRRGLLTVMQVHKLPSALCVSGTP